MAARGISELPRGPGAPATRRGCPGTARMVRCDVAGQLVPGGLQTARIRWWLFGAELLEQFHLIHWLVLPGLDRICAAQSGSQLAARSGKPRGDGASGYVERGRDLAVAQTPGEEHQGVAARSWHPRQTL